jgi:hypothetical protein
MLQGMHFCSLKCFQILEFALALNVGRGEPLFSYSGQYLFINIFISICHFNQSWTSVLDCGISGHSVSRQLVSKNMFLIQLAGVIFLRGRDNCDVSQMYTLSICLHQGYSYKMCLSLPPEVVRKIQSQSDHNASFDHLHLSTHNTNVDMIRTTDAC